MNPKLREIAQKNQKKDLPTVRVGDNVRVTVRITEGSKERNQNYEGVVIKVKGSSINKTFTVRRVFQGVGVERVFLINSPKLEKVTVLKSGKVRRAKLYYLRERTGKATRLKEQLKRANEAITSLPKEEVPEEGKLVEATTS